MTTGDEDDRVSQAGSRKPQGFPQGWRIDVLATMAGSRDHAGIRRGKRPGEADPKVAAGIAKLARVKQVLVDPPFLPEHEQTAPPNPASSTSPCPSSRRRCRSTDEGTEIWALTFNGTVPGPMIVRMRRLRRTDAAEPGTNLMEHNIDFHSATGALGGGAIHQDPAG